MKIPLPTNFFCSKKPRQLSAKAFRLDYNVKPLDLFTPLADMPWAMWLDSCQSNHIDARYDILVWQADVTLSTYGNDTHVHCLQSDNKMVSQEDPLTLLKKIQNLVLLPPEPSTQKEKLPFLGGALGYFSYDLSRRFEKIPVQAEQDINLAEMAVGLYSKAVIFDNKTEQFYLVCSEEERQQTELYLQQLLLQSKKLPEDYFTLTTNWQSNMDIDSYSEKFEQVQQYLLSGDCYQINLAQRFHANYQGDEFKAYLALRAANKAPFSAFIRLENAAILSVSPERFIQLSQGKVQSKPIKGTMPRSSNKKQDIENAEKLKNSVKDRAENVMIVDLLRNDISKVCKPNSVMVPKLFDIESFPAVHHLVSTVEGQLNEHYDGSDLLRAAFPGGSITGAPKVRAMEIIEQLEPHRRSVYCGAIGYISACGTMDTSITIRTLICQRNQHTNENNIYCWAGGGLVADSTVESEYQETFDKVNRILPILESLRQTYND